MLWLKHKFEGVQEQGAEEDIWAYEAESNRWLNKTS